MVGFTDEEVLILGIIFIGILGLVALGFVISDFYHCGRPFNPLIFGCCNGTVYNKDANSCCHGTLIEWGHRVECGGTCCEPGDKCCNDYQLGPVCFNPAVSTCERK